MKRHEEMIETHTTFITSRAEETKPLRSHDHVRTVPAHVGPKDVARGVETWLETATQDDRIQLRILLSAVMEEERVRQMGEYKNGGQ